MKREGHLMERITACDNMRLAFYHAARGKREQPEVRSFAADLSCNLRSLADAMREETLWIPPYRRFVVRDPKERTIHAAPFPMRVMQHAMMNIAGPVLERGALWQSHACRKGKGNRSAIVEAQRNSVGMPFFLKLDIRKFFDSVSHGILKGLLRAKFKDAEFLRLADAVLASYQTQPGLGLPIGSLCSQHFANFYLDGMDHRIMQSPGIRHYVRFMDDFVLWHADAAVLQEALSGIAAWLHAERALSLKGEPAVTRSSEGMGFLGYRIKQGCVLLGRMGRRRFVRRRLAYETACLAGAMSPVELQRRMDAMLAFTNVARCARWRGKSFRMHPVPAVL